MKCPAAIQFCLVMSIERGGIDSPRRGNPQHRYRGGFSKALSSWCLYRGVSASARYGNIPCVNTQLLHTGSGNSILFRVDFRGSSKENIFIQAIKCMSAWWTQQAPVLLPWPWIIPVRCSRCYAFSQLSHLAFQICCRQDNMVGCTQEHC